MFKKMFSKSLILSTALFLAVQTSHAQNRDVVPGNEGPHGGDEFASFIRARAEAIVFALRNVRKNKDLLTPEEVQRIEDAIATTAIVQAPGPLNDNDGPVDALTVEDAETGKKTIQYDRAAFAGFRRDNIPCDILIFHEFLWVIGKNDKKNIISRKLAMEADVNDEFAGTQWGLDFTGIAGTRRVMDLSFDKNLGFSIFLQAFEHSDALPKGGLWAKGYYSVKDGHAYMTYTEWSCPLPRNIQNLPPISVRTAQIRENNLYLNDTPSRSIAFERGKKVLPLGLPLEWGCLIDNAKTNSATFAAFSLGDMVGKPKAIVSKEILNGRPGKIQAIAYSRLTTKWAAAATHPNPASAIRSAVEACGRADCTLLTWGRDTCVTIARPRTSTGAYGAYGDFEASRNAALKECEKIYGDCYIEHTACPQ